MRQLAADLRYALRGLRRAPLFTAVAVMSMAFGIGANTTVFTLVDQVLLRSLPVARPDRLVQVSAPNTESYGGGMGDGTELSYAMYRDLRDHNTVFAGMFCRMPTSLYSGYQGRTEVTSGELVSGTFFPVLGLRPALGRLFTAEEDRSVGSHPYAVLGYDYWKSRFGGDPQVIGRPITVNGYRFQIIGVAQAGFQGLDLANPTQLYVPISMQPQLGPPWLKLDTRRFRWVQLYARLRDGVTMTAAQAGLQPLYHGILQQEAADAAFATASPATRAQFLKGTLTVSDAARGHSGLRRQVTEPLLILMGIAGGVLIIVCANVANLLIARGAARQRELAVRLAVGAGRRQIVRLLIVESLVLAAFGAALGILMANWGASVLIGVYADPELPWAVSASPDLRILAFTTALGVLMATLAGIVPAVRASGVALAPTLKGSGTAVGGEQPRLRKTLVVAQVALSFVLLIAAGLFVRSLKNLLDVDPGFRTERMLSFSVSLSANGYDAARGHVFLKTLQNRLGRLPGVSSVAYSFQPLLENGAWGMGMTVEGYQPKTGESAGSLCNAVSPGYFTTMAMPILAGREFTDRDDQVLPVPKGWPYRVAVVNQTFVSRYFKGANPIGRHVGIGDDPGTPMPIEIVGVTRDARYMAIREKTQPQIFFPYLQAGDIEQVFTFVRTDRDPESVMGAVRREIAALDPQLAVFDVRTMEQRVARSVVNERLIANLSATLSVMATLLSVVGLYGVMAFTVTRRTREIGLRMALGARAWEVARGVLREAGTLVVLGLALGCGAAWWLGRYIESQLYGITPADPATVALAAVVLTMVAALAALLPARRAASVDPMSALREE
jgi:predicted permease